MRSLYAMYVYTEMYNRKKRINILKNITSQELLDCAKKYFNDDYVLAILKP